MLAAANASVAGFLEYGVFMAKGALEAGVTSKTRFLPARKPFSRAVAARPAGRPTGSRRPRAAPRSVLRVRGGPEQSRCRSLLYLGQPLEGYDSPGDDTKAQIETYLKYFEDVEEDLWDHFGVDSTPLKSAYLEKWTKGGVEVRLFAWLLQRLEWLRLQQMDMVFMLCTIIFVGLWVRVHTGSCAYTGAAMGQILMSIPVTAFFYRAVLRFEYFAFLHLCSIFFVLGVGADDNFVLLDAWRQAKTDVPAVEDADETTLRRLVYAFSRTLEAVFNTSLTTAVAFLCLSASPLMPARAPRRDRSGGAATPRPRHGCIVLRDAAAATRTYRRVGAAKL